MSVLVVGSAALDSVETPHGERDNAIGGAAIFFSVAASYFTNVRLVAVVGNDFPLNEINFLKERNVDLSGLTVEDGETFRWGGKYHQDMNIRDTLFTHLNVFETFDPELPESYKKTPTIFLANILPDLQMKVLEQATAPELVVLDTMNYWIDGALESLKQVLKRVNILIINDSETMQLGNNSNLLVAAENVMAMGPKILVVKKGEHGALLVTENGYFFAPALPLKKVIDPTGAGDTFAGGFVGYLDNVGQATENNLRKAVIYGSVMASFCVEDFSIAKTKSLTQEMIDARYHNFRRLTEIL